MTSTAFDIQLLNKAIYDRLKTDAAGSAVRALLGGSASSVIHAVKVADKPARPFVALHAGAIPGSSRDVRIPTFTWWIYDDKSQGYARIGDVAEAIEAAYTTTRIDLSTTVIDRVEVANIGAETSDEKLVLLVRTLQLAAYVL